MGRCEVFEFGASRAVPRTMLLAEERNGAREAQQCVDGYPG